MRMIGALVAMMCLFAVTGPLFLIYILIAVMLLPKGVDRTYSEVIHQIVFFPFYLNTVAK